MKLRLSISLLLLWGISSPLLAQESKEENPEELTIVEVITVGSRRPERSKTDTPVPVDVVPISEISSKTGQLDLGQLLQFVAPSFNSNRQSGSDGSDHVDAATLRGLGPDQVLVLINGKRRHTSSLVYLFGTRARGNVGTDLNSIPVAAIKRIEILRDGAAAQYGSDAIAGVINIVLREDTGLEVNLAGGVYSEGDGENGQLALNYGHKIGERGVVNLTGEYLDRARTNRSPEGEPRIIGDAATENINLFANLEVEAGETGTFYGHGGYNTRDGLAGAWYRDGVGSDDIPSRNSEAMYPDGFVPNIGTEIDDFSMALGYRTLVQEWNMDFSSSYGSNKMMYIIRDTLNASIATQNNGISPTVFDAGGFEFTQHTTNFDLSRYYTSILSGMNLAAGLEYRVETYQIFAGEQGSWDDYDGPGGGNAGSQGFPGFQPADEVDKDRESTAAYLDLEFQFSPEFMVGTAVRGEDYSDFGSTLTGKLVMSYRPSSQFQIRASGSTGFRAPSLHQRWFSSTFTDFIAGEPADIKLAPNGSELAALAGIPSLEEETSVNSTLGFTYVPRQDWNITLDAYLIEIDDRIVLTGGFTADDLPVLEDLNLVEARFFTNAIDTRTKGIDFTINNRRKALGGDLASFVALNWNKTDVLRINTAPGLEGKENIYFNERERMFVEGSAPEIKATVTEDYVHDKWGLTLKLTYFGKVLSGTWSQIDDASLPPQRYGSKVTTDLSVNYTFRFGGVLTVGGTNLFDEQPTSQDPYETENGAPWENVQMGINGAFYFVRLTLRP
jgi:iron complex outermembrane receptor protein